jgi:dihydrofolate reductase
MTLAHIVAAAENNVIGNEGKLPWHIAEDLKFFRDTTRGHVVIMGRKTYETLGKPLPNRLNVIVSRQPGYQADGAVVVESLEAAYAYSREQTAKWGDVVFILGGGEIYKQSLKDVDLIYLTRVRGEYKGDAKYPELDKTKFAEIARRECQGSPSYIFLTYKKVPGT